MKCGRLVLKGNTAFALRLSIIGRRSFQILQFGTAEAEGCADRLSVRRTWRDIKVNAVRMALRPDRRFTGVAGLEWPEQRSAERRAPDMDIAERHARPIRLLAHRGKTAFVGIGTAAEQDLFTGLGMKYGKRLGAAGGKQAQDKERKAVHARRLQNGPSTPSVALPRVVVEQPIAAHDDA